MLSNFVSVLLYLLNLKCDSIIKNDTEESLNYYHYKLHYQLLLSDMFILSSLFHTN